MSFSQDLEVAFEGFVKKEKKNLSLLFLFLDKKRFNKE